VNVKQKFSSILKGAQHTSGRGVNSSSASVGSGQSTGE